MFTEGTHKMGPLFILYIMLRLDQVKSIYLPLNLTSKLWTKLIKGCPQVVSLHDILKAYLEAYGLNLYTDNTIDGTGTLADPYRIAQQGATTNETLLWNGTTWVPGSPLGLPAGEPGDLLVYNGSTYVTVTRITNIQILSAGTVATLPHVPSPLMDFSLYLNGLLKEEGADYTLVSNVITFTYPFQTSDKLITKYYI